MEMSKTVKLLGLGTGLLAVSVFGIMAGGKPTNPGLEKFEKIYSATHVDKNVTPKDVPLFYGGKAEHGSEFDPKEMCFKDEQEFVKIRSELLTPFVESFVTKDMARLKTTFAKEISFSPLSQFEKGSTQKHGSIIQDKWRLSESLVSSMNSVESHVGSYLEAFSQIEDFELKTYRIISYKENRDPSSFEMKEAVLLSRFDLRGLDRTNQRRNDRGVAKLLVQKKQEGWKIKTFEVVDAETLVATSPSFIDATNGSQVGNIPVHTRNEAIRRGGYALATEDYDGDGHVDMYVGAWGEGQLLKGDGKGNFKPVANSGLGGENLVKTAIFGDFNNSGHQDLLLVRFVPTEKAMEEEGSYSDIVLYKNEGDGTFAKVEKPIRERIFTPNAMPAAAADFTNNGMLDFYVGFPGTLDFSFIGNASKIMQGAKVQGLFFNQGNHSFVDKTDYSLSDVRTEAQELFPHSSVSVDFDQNGLMDLIVLDDRGHLSPIYKNIGDGKFVEATEATGLHNRNLAMGAAVGDVYGDGNLDFVISNVNFTAAERWDKSCSHNWHDISEKSPGATGLRLYRGKKGKVTETTELAGLDWAGEGIAGVEFIDYNSDGKQDLYVANGLWSGTDKGQDMSSLFVRSMIKYRYSFVNEMYDGETESDFMRVLKTFEGDINKPFDKTANKVERPSLAGYQRNRLFRNIGDGEFLEVGYLEGVDSIADGYVVSVADINNDNKMDLILRNGDPGTKSHMFPAVEVFLNNNSEGNNHLLVDLEGTESNKDGVGAFVKAELKDGQSLLRHMIANNGTAQSEKVLHFGLGVHDKVEKLTVTWPSGVEQVLKDLKKGRVKIKEQRSPESVTAKK